MVMRYLSWATGDPHYVLGVEARERLGLLFIGEEGVEVLELIIAAPTVNLPVICERQAVSGSHGNVNNFFS